MFLFKYPGVAESIDSDIDSLMGILKYGNILPEGKKTHTNHSFCIEHENCRIVQIETTSLIQPNTYE